MAVVREVVRAGLVVIDGDVAAAGAAAAMTPTTRAIATMKIMAVLVMNTASEASTEPRDPPGRGMVDHDPSNEWYDLPGYPPKWVTLESGSG